MRLLLIFTTVFICISCIIQQDKSINKRIQVVRDPSLYRVYKIDSIHNYYLIYAKRKDTLYKIVTDKSHSENCELIKVNEEYNFKLKSLLANRSSSKIKLTLEALLRINGINYDDSTTVSLERDSINDLHSADNITGLCFLRDHKQKKQ